MIIMRNNPIMQLFVFLACYSTLYAADGFYQPKPKYYSPLSRRGFPLPPDAADTGSVPSLALILLAMEGIVDPICVFNSRLLDSDTWGDYNKEKVHTAFLNTCKIDLDRFGIVGINANFRVKFVNNPSEGGVGRLEWRIFTTGNVAYHESDENAPMTNKALNNIPTFDANLQLGPDNVTLHHVDLKGRNRSRVAGMKLSRLSKIWSLPETTLADGPLNQEDTYLEYEDKEEKESK